MNKIRAISAAAMLLMAAGGASAACNALTFSGTPLLAPVVGSFAGAGSNCHTFDVGPSTSISTGLFGFSFGPGSFTAALTGPGLGVPFAIPTTGSIVSTILGQGSYTLTVNYSGGIGGAYFGTVSAVPEPGTIALMLAGLGVVGFMARRRAGAAGSSRAGMSAA